MNNVRVGESYMLWDPSGKMIKSTVVDVHEFLQGGKVLRKVTLNAGKIHHTLDWYHAFEKKLTPLPKGWGMSFDSPLPKPIKVGTVVQFRIDNVNSGHYHDYTVRVRGMSRQGMGSDPYYSAVFVCEVLKAERINQSSYSWITGRPQGSLFWVGIDQFGGSGYSWSPKILEKGNGKELIPYRIYLTASEESRLHKQEEKRWGDGRYSRIYK